MNRIDRLHAILIHLQSKRIVKAEELSKKFDVSIRTIYRDIRALEEGGVPIGAEAGIGYFLIDGYQLPPVMFTKEEARALLVGGKLLEKQSDKEVSAAFQQALTKIRAVLDDEKKDEIEDLEQSILVNPFPFGKAEEEIPQLSQIKSAISQRRTLEFEYFSNYKAEWSSREVEPIGLCFYSGSWHVIAFCLLRDDYRDFRMDRITKLKISSNKYRKHERLSLQQYIDKLIADTELLQCIIKVDIEVANILQNHKYQMGLVNEVKKQDHIEMSFATPSYDYFARWLLMMTSSVEILGPAKLKEVMKNLVNELSIKYSE